MKKKIETNFFCESNHWSRRMKKIKKIVSQVLYIDDCGFNKKNSYFLNLIFVDDKKIKMINKMYRNKNKTTDVLTFVTYLNNEKLKNQAYCDIFFSAEMIKKDAKKNLINFYDHLAHLIIHCFLHVNGYEHNLNSDFLKMKKLEKKILNVLGIKNPYIYE
ncbi:rRNA maturation RNase YbeY [Pelagibacteraceae bacterium]|nr:rRNA maturation RNase YbeY [Pelagibacteraceae bacterium]